MMIGSTVLLAAALALTGCAAGSSSAGDAGAPVPADGVQQPGVAGDESGGGSAGGGSTSSDRQVVISGDVTITAEDPLAASKQAVRIVEAAGGRVDDRTEYAAGENDNGSAQLTLRIPADSLTAVLDKLEKLGTTEQVSLSTSDVTVETQDLDARIDALRASIGRLNALIAKAKNISDLIALESEISSRQGELESLEAQQRYLADQVAMSSITLYLQSTAQAPATQPDTFWDGLATGWGAFVAFWAGLLVVLGVLLPWIVTVGIIALVIVLLVRRRQARSRSSASSAKP
jgi:hypothetical protein